MLEPENDIGNIEYKLKLIEDDDQKINELVTQMRYRINEGNGEAIYNLGVKDNGKIEGITQEEYEKTISILNIVSNKNNYYINLLSSQELENGKKIYEILVREITNSYIDIKIPILGAVDSGKSSTIGCLTTGKLDNGRGLSRSSVFNYIHEFKSGRTSSVAHHILGYDKEGKTIYYDGKSDWTDIVNKSSKIINFYDLCGHEKYLKTTIHGIASSNPDLCFIMVSSNNGVSKLTKEHIFLTVTLGIPFCILLTKIDLCQERKNVLEETISNINKILKYPGIRKLPLTIKNNEDIILAAKNLYNESIVPIFHISNTTGQGLEHIKYFLNIVGKRNSENYNNYPVEYHIDNIFMVSGYKFIIGGQLLKGTIKVNDKLFIGPIENEYHQVTIKSIHCKKTPVQEISCGSYVCIGLNKKFPIKKGNVLISNKDHKLLVKKFSANITVLKSHSTTVKIGYEPILHSSSIRETVKIIEINNKKNARNIEDNIETLNVLRSGDTALVTFEFKYNYHFLKIGSKIILCEGFTKIVGDVVSIIDLQPY